MTMLLPLLYEVVDVLVDHVQIDLLCDHNLSRNLLKVLNLHA